MSGLNQNQINDVIDRFNDGIALGMDMPSARSASGLGFITNSLARGDFPGMIDAASFMGLSTPARGSAVAAITYSGNRSIVSAFFDLVAEYSRTTLDPAIFDVLPVLEIYDKAIRTEKIAVLFRQALRVNKTVDDAVGEVRGQFGVDCFPADTIISLADGSKAPIDALQPGDEVACFASGGLRDGSITPLTTGTIARLFRNVTTEWITLVLPEVIDPNTGGAREITSTPGHVFLAPDGQFRRLCDMIDGSVVPLKSDAIAHKQGAEHYRPVGMVEIVLEDGTIATAEAHSIKYSAATAHLYEEAEMLVTRTEGGLAIKPEVKMGWKTYNFKVEKYHTCIVGKGSGNDNNRNERAA